MAISKANFNSFNITPTASKFITFNSSNNGLAADDVGGALQLISTQTASNSSTISFTSGIDSTYKEYIFKFYNCHPATDNVDFTFQGSTNNGSSYGVAITSSHFRTYHDEADSGTALEYSTSDDLHNSTNYQVLAASIGNENDESVSGTLHLFDPSNTTFVKNFICESNNSNYNIYTKQQYVGGRLDTTSAIDAIQFKMSSGNIDSGVIKLYGVN